MQHGRDSSVWRSLATAFGDGLAFGVGVKLTQTVARRAEAPTAAAPAASFRLDEVEQRIARIEQSPAAGFNRKVMEAVVAALDARLQAHAGQMERRLTDLEARMALEMNAIREENPGGATDAQLRFDAAEARLTAQLNAARQAMELEFAALTAQREEFTAMARQLIQAEAAAQVKQAMNALRAEIAPAIAGGVAHEAPRLFRAQMAAAEERLRRRVDTAVEDAIASRTAGLQDALEYQVDEIADLRRQVKEARAASAEVLQALSQACRETAGRIAITPADESEAEESLFMLPHSVAPAAEASSEQAVDREASAFERAQPSTRPWRVPLVGSFLLAAVSAAITLMRVA